MINLYIIYVDCLPLTAESTQTNYVGKILPYFDQPQTNTYLYIDIFP